MGRATVISGGTDGRYVIEMDYGSAQRDAMIAKIDLDLYQLGLRKTWQEEQLDEVAIGLVSLQNEQTAFINAYVAASKLIPPNKELTESIRKQLDAKTAEVIRQQLIVNNARVALGMTNAQIKSAELERAKLEQAEIIEQRPAWCADLTENATGTVATLEVPGESALILVKPSAPEATITDGRLIAREVQTPAQVFWNAAVLPGWQKFKPTYRWGTITELNTLTDRCTVALAEAKSSAQQLNVNQAATLANVPIQYMTCNAAAFTVGSNVIVEFTGQDWAQPKVIGFLDHPRACGGPMLGVPASDDHHSSDGPTLIWKNYASTAMPDELVSGLDIDSHPGHITWSSRSFKIGTREVQISWKGADSRYSEALGWSESGGGDIVPYEIEEVEVGMGYEPWYIGDVNALYTATSYVWIDGRRVDTGIKKVIAAAFYRPDPTGAPNHVVLRVCSDNYPQDNTTRGMVVYDLSCASDTPGGCTLAELAQASSLSIDSVYPALDFTTVDNPPAGKWRHRQHPHFDSLGQRLATTIVEAVDWGLGNVMVAAFSIPSWSISQRVYLPSSYTTVQTSTEAGVVTAGLYESVTLTGESSQDQTDTYIVAVDWLRNADANLPDDLVYVTLTKSVQSSGDSVNDADSASVFSYTQSNASTTTFEVTHSRHGVLKTETRTASRDVSGSVSGATATASASVGSAYMFKVAFTGDLSRDVFAIGFAQGLNHASYTVGGDIVEWYLGAGSTAQQSIASNNHRILYDVWFAGTAILSGNISGYSESYSPSGSTFQDHATIYDSAARLIGEAPVSPGTETTTTTREKNSGLSIWSSNLCAARVKFGHLAVAPERSVAYFGVNHWHGSTNLVLRNAPPALPAVQTVPDYADGDNATLAAPLFLGVSTHYPG